jgi:hypothetical protein
VTYLGTLTPGLRGAILGILVGPCTWLIYVGLFIIIWFGGATYQAIFYARGEQLVEYFIFGPLTVITLAGIGVIGLLPGMVLGLITGTLVSLLIDVLHQHLNIWSSVILGAGVSVSMILLISWFLLAPDLKASYNFDFWMLLILPSLLYIAAGSWMGWKLYAL